MLQIARNNRTERLGDLQKLLKIREKIYGKNLEPNWFTYDSDLGVKAKTIQERNKARAMLAAAPLMQAQLGALEFRKRMMQGDDSILSTMRLEESMTISQILKKLEAVSPLAILRLFNKEVGNFVSDSLLQHSDDLDYVQDILDTISSHTALTPTMHAVLEGFSRRRNYGLFKYNDQSVAMDRIRLAYMASPEDKDGESVMKRNRQSFRGKSRSTWNFFQRRKGCREEDAC